VDPLVEAEMVARRRRDRRATVVPVVREVPVARVAWVSMVWARTVVPRVLVVPAALAVQVVRRRPAPRDLVVSVEPAVMVVPVVRAESPVPVAPVGSVVREQPEASEPTRRRVPMASVAMAETPVTVAQVAQAVQVTPSPVPRRTAVTAEPEDRRDPVVPVEAGRAVAVLPAPMATADSVVMAATVGTRLIRMRRVVALPETVVLVDRPPRVTRVTVAMGVGAERASTGRTHPQVFPRSTVATGEPVVPVVPVVPRRPELVATVDMPARVAMAA
jgi:hypothetical protein